MQARILAFSRLVYYPFQTPSITFRYISTSVTKGNAYPRIRQKGLESLPDRENERHSTHIANFCPLSQHHEHFITHFHSFISENHPLQRPAKTGDFLQENGGANAKKRARKKSTSILYFTLPYENLIHHISAFLCKRSLTYCHTQSIVQKSHIK